MKKILTSLFLLIITPSVVMADWTDDFLEVAQRDGLDHAVAYALHNNITPEKILLFARDNSEINEEMTLKALYCAGSDRNEIRQIAIKLGVPNSKIAKALEKSIAECDATLVLDDRMSSRIFASPSTP